MIITEVFTPVNPSLGEVFEEFPYGSRHTGEMAKAFFADFSAKRLFPAGGILLGLFALSHIGVTIPLLNNVVTSLPVGVGGLAGVVGGIVGRNVRQNLEISSDPFRGI